LRTVVHIHMSEDPGDILLFLTGEEVCLFFIVDFIYLSLF